MLKAGFMRLEVSVSSVSIYVYVKQLLVSGELLDTI